MGYGWTHVGMGVTHAGVRLTHGDVRLNPMGDGSDLLGGEVGGWLGVL